jgi:hypothetical protein
MNHIAKVICAAGLFVALQSAQAEDATPADDADQDPVYKQAKAYWDDYYRGLKQYDIAVQGNRIQFTPVFTDPAMQWAVPNNNFNGPPANLTDQVNRIQVPSVQVHSIMQWSGPTDSELSGPPTNLSTMPMMPD